ncbi:DUF4349 domain-containing protein [Streptosporangium sandarakinum]|uniref:DUF4349 domain-containing protein n=1 Tax=Streptosporangium sandarakinum TaxID=1260955 RepID=UPI0033BE1695
MNRFRYGLRPAIALAATMLALTACGGGGTAQMRSQSGEGAPAVARDAAQDQGFAESAASGGGAEKSGSAATGAPAEQVDPVPQDRQIVYTAELTVRVKDVAAASERARGLVDASGGYLATERSGSSNGDQGSANLVFKIPPSAYPGVLARLGKELGVREAVQQNTKDVTEQVADVDSRVRSAKASLDSLRALLKRANKIGEVLEIEREISSRETELEALQARQRSLAARTSMATLTLNLVGPEVVVPEPEDESSGFLGGLRTGWRSFVEALKIGLTVLGVLLPWTIAAGLVWLVVAFVLRRTRRNRPDRPTPPPAPREEEPESRKEEPEPREEP